MSAEGGFGGQRICREPKASARMTVVGVGKRRAVGRFRRVLLLFDFFLV